MKWWQFFFLMAVAYLGPHTPMPTAITLGLLLLIAGFVTLWRGE